MKFYRIRKYQALSHTLLAALSALMGMGQELFAQTTTKSFYRPNSESMVTRSDLFMPITSFVLPGTSQWANGQYGYAAVYTSVAVGGVIYAGEASKDIDSNGEDSQRIDSKGVAERKQILGLQTYQSMGGFSLFHSFRSAVSLRQKEGAYQFLKTEERPEDLALAPFRFSYLTRSTTWIPLASGALINLWIARQPPDGWTHDRLRPRDAAFASGFSWNAGTHEEALFRGWMMPVFREYWMNDTWANGSQSVIFAAAHLDSTPVPLAQLILGWHLGRVTTMNQWSLGESIFIHAWWDVLAFLTIYSLKEDEKPREPARIHLPPLQYSF